jgi:undecaprenyl-diphosphatase
MLSIFQAIIIGLVQGFTELFPVSSLGHSVILPKILHWNIQQTDPHFLTFLIATHLATAIVLFLFFWHDWVKILKGLVRSIRSRQIAKDDTYARLGWLLVAGSIPAGILGLLFEKSLRHAFASARIAAAFLIVNGVILWTADYLRARAITRRERNTTSDEKLVRLRFSQAFLIGLAQAAALLPGISRSGSAMAGGLRAGLDYENAARFSFLLATPIIGAAAVLKLPELFSPDAASIRSAIIVGSLCAAASAFVSVKFLVRYFETRTLKPFAIYSVIAGVAVSLYLIVG